MKFLFKVLPLIALFFSASLFAEPANLSLLKTEIKSYHDSGLYEKELAQAIHKAHNYIIHQAKTNSHKKLALVLDIDETSLSNYNKMAPRDFCGTQKEFHADIQAADAPAIKPMLALYRDALRHGVKVFFVTGRPESERAATKRNLTRAGYAHWSGLYLRPKNYSNPSISPFKAKARESISQKGYIVVATIGDQFSDLNGGYAKKGFKLPNPFYYLP